MIKLPFGCLFLHKREVKFHNDEKMFYHAQNDILKINDKKLFLDTQTEHIKLVEHQNDRLTQELEEKETIVKRHLEILRERNTVIRNLTKQIYELKDEQNNVDNLNWHIRQLLEGIKWSFNRSFLFNQVQVSKAEEPETRTEREEESSD